MAKFKNGDFVFVEEDTGILTDRPFNERLKQLNYCIGLYDTKKKIIFH